MAESVSDKDKNSTVMLVHYRSISSYKDNKPVIPVFIRLMKR